jgi:hypothetical protein
MIERAHSHVVEDMSWGIWSKLTKWSDSGGNRQLRRRRRVDWNFDVAESRFRSELERSVSAEGIHEKQGVQRCAI